MQVRQLQVSNDSVQDRLVLRIATQANEEIRVYFTRRFLRELWPHLVNMLSGHLAAAPQTAPVATAENGTTSAPAPTHSFDQPFQNDNPLYPLGATPLLASEASLTAAGDGQARLVLREGRERSFNLGLNGELLQALCSMLRAGAEQANWNLALDYGRQQAPRAKETPVMPSDKPSLLH